MTNLTMSAPQFFYFYCQNKYVEDIMNSALMSSNAAFLINHKWTYL